MSLLMRVGSLTIFRYFSVGVSAVIVMVFSFVSTFTSFSSTPGNSAKTVMWASSSKMSMSGSLCLIKLDIEEIVLCAMGDFNLPSGLLTWKMPPNAGVLKESGFLVAVFGESRFVQSG